MARMNVVQFMLPVGSPQTWQYSVSVANGFTYCWNSNSAAGIWRYNTLNPSIGNFVGSFPQTGIDAYGGGCFDPINNIILIAPAIQATHFIEIDLNNSDAINQLGTNLGTGIKYTDAYFYNGKICGFPRSVLAGYIFDCATKTFSFFNTVAGVQKYQNAWGIGDDVYCGSFQRNAIGKLNLISNTFSELPLNLNTILGNANVRVGGLNGDLYVNRTSNVPAIPVGFIKVDLATNAHTFLNNGIFGSQPFQAFNRLYHFTNIDIASINPTFQSLNTERIVNTIAQIKVEPFNNYALSFINDGFVNRLNFKEV